MRAPLLTAALHGLSRRFWIVGAATVTVCAVLAAQAAGHVVEARYLTDANHATSLPRVVSAPAPLVAAQPARNPSLLVERNMFCSDCVGAGDPEPNLGTGVPASSLPLILVATSLGSEPWATLRNTGSGAQGAYGVGDRIPHAGTVEHVAGTWIDVMNDSAGRLERIQLLAPAVADTVPPKVTATAAAQPYADRVRKLDDHTYEVDRQLVRDLVSGGKVDGVLVRPMTKGDKLLGIKVVQARPTSIAAAIGLKPGDLIEGIDGAKIESAQQVIDMLARLDDISSVRLDGTRKGAALGLDLKLR
jgi:hypothetical protein